MPTGQLRLIPRPVTNAIFNFNSAQPGVVQIVGARRPRRTTQYQEGRPVTARDINQLYTDIVAQNRESWDLRSRTIQAPAGETMTVLPSATVRARSFLLFDALGNPSVGAALNNSIFPPAPAGTFKGNAQSVAGPITDVALGALPGRPVPNANNDKLLVLNSDTGAFNTSLRARLPPRQQRACRPSTVRLGRPSPTSNRRGASTLNNIVTSATIQAAQAAVVDNVVTFQSGNIDTLTTGNRQTDGTHLNDAGAAGAATLIYNAMRASGAPF